jgi:hypothetical protein
MFAPLVLLDNVTFWAAEYVPAPGEKVTLAAELAPAFAWAVYVERLGSDGAELTVYCHPLMYSGKLEAVPVPSVKPT